MKYIFKEDPENAVIKKRCKKRSVKPVDIPNNPWHTKLLKFLETSEGKSYRKIIWICDPIGNTGKTWFGKYLMDQPKNDYFTFKYTSISRDTVTIINALNTGWSGHGLVLNLPRSAKYHDRIYDYIAAIKDGVVTSIKYSGKIARFDNQVLIIMANWWPQIYRHGKLTLSLDRWTLYHITPDKNLVEKTIQEVRTYE